MGEIISLSGGKHRYVIDSDQSSEQALSLHLENGTHNEIIVELTGTKPLKLHLETEQDENSQLTFLSINHCQNDLQLQEKHVLHGGVSAVMAYAQLENANADIDNEYELDGQGANLQVTGASLTKGRKTLQFNCVHSAKATTAHIDNYGVVLAKGHCEMIIKNTIQAGCHKSSTHQSSRILSYDKTSYGRILPILYIDDNDVAASHAASLGQPDENQLYYMESRGLTHQQALSLITIGYLMPVTQTITDESVNSQLKQEIEEKVQQL